ncbi:MAG: transaldolase family protein [Nitrospinota bacterium]|nr:transaldolase family protein [Nitrospinota bacterium]
MALASKKLEEVIHDIAFVEIGEGEPPVFDSHELAAKLVSLGTKLWIDTGDLDLARSIWKKEFTSLTTNNTLANQVVQKGVMDGVIRETAEKLREMSLDLPENELIMEIGFVINCKIALRLVEAFRYKVSVELHPAVSRDFEKTLYYARRYYKVCPQFFNVKIPLTPEGYLAVRKLRQEGIPINFTLGFSARQNYLAAALANPDYVNVFLGRLNQVVADNSLGSGRGVGEKVTLATQRAIRELREDVPSIQTQLIGASIRNGDQVAILAGLDVLTIPPTAMKGFLDSGRTPEQVECRLDQDIAVEVDPDPRFSQLWEVSEKFKKFVKTLIRSDRLEDLSGEELIAVCESYQIDLFHQFSQEDCRKIYDHGKIPKLADWPDLIALDDLMTKSALQSFAKDQDALDNRIRSFLV